MSNYECKNILYLGECRWDRWGWYIIKDKLETLLIQKILLIIQSYYQENQKETEKLINDLVMLFMLYGHNQSAEYIVAQRPEYPYTWETIMSYVKPLGMTDSQRKKIIQTLFDFSNNIYADFLCLPLYSRESLLSRIFDNLVKRYITIKYKKPTIVQV